MKSYGKAIRRINEQIPEGGIDCPPGCNLCCGSHTWTWTEWDKVAEKRIALSANSRCPYSSPKGCLVYEQRPVICRLFGLCSTPIFVGNFPMPISFACKLGLQPTKPLPEKRIRELYIAHMTIIRSEMDDLRADNQPLYTAGPYGPYARERGNSGARHNQT